MEILCHEDNHLSQNCCYEVKLGYFLYIFLVGNTQHTNMFALKIAIIFAKRNSSRTMKICENVTCADFLAILLKATNK